MSATKEIVSEMKTISNVLQDNSIIFYIPDFQRNFVWGLDEITQLLSDFSEDTNEFKVENEKLEGYLLGNIVLIDDDVQPQRRIVVDGQQRLTTLSLISKALYMVVMERIDTQLSSLEKNKWWMKIGHINKGFWILDSNSDFKALKIQHDPSLGFGNYYKKLISDDPNLDDEDVKSDDDENVKKVYTVAYEFLVDLNDEQLRNFIDYFSNKIKIIVTSAPTEAKAFQLFEILNDRGKSLEPMDLIKNKFLKILNTEGYPQPKIDSFNENWRSIMSNLEIDSKRKIASSTFLKQYILAYKGENVKADKLFDYIKDPKTGFNSGDSVLKFVDDMTKVSKHYRNIEKGDFSVFNDDQNMFILFKLLSIKQFHPLLMLFYYDNDDNKKRILDSVTRLGAAVLFSYTQTNYIEKILSGIIKKYISLKEKDADSAFNNLIQDIENHINQRAQDVKIILGERNFVGRNGELHSKALMMLKFIELYFNQNTKIMKVPKGKKITAEHILSKNIDVSIITNDKLGFIDDKERSDYKHRIGNLTLLYNTDNSSVGNKIYSDKKECYKGSDFIITKTLIQPLETTVANGKDTRLYKTINMYEKQYISDNDNWNKAQIEDRSKDIAVLMYHLLTDTMMDN